MPLRSVIFRFQNANTKAKCKWKGKCIGKWFLTSKCGIYLLNDALKRIFTISECKYKSKIQMQRQMHRKMVFYALNAAFILLNATLKRDFSISECKYKGKMQIQRQMHRKMVFMPYMRHLSLECRFEAYFFDFRMQIQRQIQTQRQMHRKIVFMP